MKKLFIGSLLVLSSLSMASDRSMLRDVNEGHELEELSPLFTRGVENPFNVDPFQKVVSRLNFQKFSVVIKGLHEAVEQESDLIYIVNTSDQETSCIDLANLAIPKQHMVLLKRRSPNAPIFLRDVNGLITGINPEGASLATLAVSNGRYNYSVKPVFKSIEAIASSESAYIPVSSGIAKGKMIQTYSGIFRVNERRTNDMRKSTNTTSDPMQNSVYINAEYNDGAEARLALHGTFERAWPLLGKQRASSGCIRLHTDFSKWNQDLLFSKAKDGQLVPRSEYTSRIKVWNRRDYLPPAEPSFNRLSNGTKLRVLIVFFDGYSESCI